MILLKGVTKVYHSKKGTDTLALNNVNLKLEDKGMVFIVGKSGSGKSTLLNILGGLDMPSKGTLSIYGKKLIKKDYDGYRNTYIGFVFQEFNILEQYTIYENIELSLKLQKEKVKRERITGLLEKLGLSGLEKRKPNELSGGQKQRVAIARALIKEPEMILADEPTGNLDSHSSEQIFDILKEISKEKLVVVVSHDLEAAKKYADRLIQIEDGKVKNDNVTEIEEKKGTFHTKKSKLPLLYAWKVALHNLKYRPFKLLMTILLTAISLIFMGITMNFALFDTPSFIVDVLNSNKNHQYEMKYMNIGHYGATESLEFTKYQGKIEKEIGAITNPKYVLYDNGNSLSFQFPEKKDKNEYFDMPPIYLSYIEVKDSRILNHLIGRAPVNSNEFVIHKYMAEYIMEYGVQDSLGEWYQPKTLNQLVEDEHLLKLGDNNVKIVGIIDDENTKFEQAKKTGHFSKESEKTYFDTIYRLKGNEVYVKNFVPTVHLNHGKDILKKRTSLEYHKKELSQTFDYVTKPVTLINNTGVVKNYELKPNEIVLSLTSLKDIDKKLSESLEIYLNENQDGIYQDLIVSYLTEYLKTHSFKPLLLKTFNIRTLIENEVTVVGVTTEEHSILSEHIFDHIEPITSQMISLKVYEDDENKLKSVFQKYSLDTMVTEEMEGNHFLVSIDYGMETGQVAMIYHKLYPYLFIVSLVFTLFTILLFTNFISVSISYSKKEIGILRAIGAKQLDVLKIFIYESLLIGFVAWLFSTIGFYMTTNLLNETLFGTHPYVFHAILVNPLVPVLMFVFTVFISCIITILSIKPITHIKPIDAILNK